MSSTTDQLKPYSREWFALKVSEVKARIEGYPVHIKANMVEATATLPTLTRRTPTGATHDN